MRGNEASGNTAAYILFGVVLVVLFAVLVVLIQISSNISYLNGELQRGSQSVSNSTGSLDANIGYLTVTATGDSQAQVTKASIDTEFQGRGLTAAAATANLSSELNDANAILSRYINGNMSLIQTNYYNLYNQSGYYYTSYNGYVAMEDLSMTIPNVGNVSSVLGSLSAVNGISINDVSGVLTNAQISALRLTALTSAVENATAQARALLPGRNLSVSNITVGYRYPIYPVPLVSGVASSSAANSSEAASPQYFNGTESVTESVTVTFAYDKQ